MSTYDSNNNKTQRVLDTIKAAGYDGMIISFSDLYQNEFPKPELAPVQLTLGFMGSSGTVGQTIRPNAILGHDRSAVFVDSRYLLEAQQYFAGTSISTCDLSIKALGDWLRETPDIRRLAADRRLFSVRELNLIESATTNAGRELGFTVDFYAALQAQGTLNNEQAPRPLTGDASDVSPQEKLNAIRISLGKKRSKVYVTTNNEEVAWLLNIRSKENPYLPCPNCWLAISRVKGGCLYFPGNPELLDQVLSHFTALDISVIFDYEAWTRKIAELGDIALIDETRMNAALYQDLKELGLTMRGHQSDVPLKMSIKSAGEIKASISAHVEDGIAKTRFLFRLHNSIIEDNDEYQSIVALDGLRRDRGKYLGPSFPWVSCAGPNGAKPHYKPQKGNCLPISDGSIYLIDSGGQYVGATTDVTRTVYLGDAATADLEFRRQFTLVLQSFIRGSSSKVPTHSTAAQLDAITRAPLWARNFNFGHGTGHGVGAGLSIHENPIIISGRSRDFELQTGMIFSIEPGNYVPNRWGIRIENLVVAAEDSSEGAGWLNFAPLTLVPIQVALIEKHLLAPDEIAWLNAYHATVIERLQSYLGDHEMKWLMSYARAI
jgi:Xaa-Pro aminopeptidase